MHVDEQQSPALTQHGAHGAHPGIDILDPVEDSDGGVHQVESVVQHSGQVSGVRLDEVHLHTAARCDVAGTSEGGSREVDAGHMCPEPG
jgi:hypothetical protein